jgi:predicted nucleic-acid-binding protein
VLNSVVLAEFAWTMRRGYRYDRLEIVEAIEGIMRSPGLVTLDRDAINAAINRCREENLHFADALIGELNRSAGCATTLTFDGKAMKAEGLFSAPE